MPPYDRRLTPYIHRMAQNKQIRNLAASTIDSYTWHMTNSLGKVSPNKSFQSQNQHPL